MSGRLERAASFFLAPAEAPGRPAAAPVPPAVRAVVLGAPRDVAPLAAAVALALQTPGLVALWHAQGAAAPGLSTRSAARLAARLSARDLPAVARGRLAWLVLPDDPEEAAVAVRRASPVVDGPLVTALAGARPPALEELVGEHDLAVVAADPDTPLARTALAGLTARGVEAMACPPLRRGLSRRAARDGLTAPRLRQLGIALTVERA